MRDKTRNCCGFYVHFPDRVFIFVRQKSPRGGEQGSALRRA